MLHPFYSCTEIEATLEICTLWKGVPHGLAIIYYKYPECKWNSFRGIGVFNRGQLHNAPFICIWNYGTGSHESGQLFSKMQNGRTANDCFETSFMPKMRT